MLERKSIYKIDFQVSSYNIFFRMPSKNKRSNKV